MNRKVCIVTATRAEYGPLRWLMEDIKNDLDLELQLVVTGTHLSVENGFTYDDILNDGLVADILVEMPLARTDQDSLVKAMGHCQIGMADALSNLNPDILVVLGDRYELLPICAAAVVMNIPIAHISGGDVTEGAIDEQIRHAVTKMAFLHFPGTLDSAQRIIKMGENPLRVFPVGEPGLDALYREKTRSRSEMAKDFNLDEGAEWILFTYHPETMGAMEEDLLRVKNVIEFFTSKKGIQLIATGANADCGGSDINDYLLKQSVACAECMCFQTNFGARRYFQLLHHVSCVVGNSSSGIIEAPALKVPVINIGDRQKGRHLCRNIISCDGSMEGLSRAFREMQSASYKKELLQTEAYYGDGKTSARVVSVLKDFDIQSLRKKFYEGGSS